jgi:hypothetical protein
MNQQTVTFYGSHPSPDKAHEIGMRLYDHIKYCSDFIFDEPPLPPAPKKIPEARRMFWLYGADKKLTYIERGLTDQEAKDKNPLPDESPLEKWLKEILQKRPALAEPRCMMILSILYEEPL